MIIKHFLMAVSSVLFLLPTCACAQVGSSSQYSPQNNSKATSKFESRWQDLKEHREAFMQRFCSNHKLSPESDECKKKLFTEWRKASLESGSEYSKQGFQDLDKLTKKSLFKLGEKWEEYSREFEAGRKAQNQP